MTSAKLRYGEILKNKLHCVATDFSLGEKIINFDKHTTKLIGAIIVVLISSFIAVASQTTMLVKVYHTSPGMKDSNEVLNSGIFELTFAQQADYGGQKNFSDIDIQVTFNAPSGKNTTIGGFYYDTLANKLSLWKARFVPQELGTWTYSYTFVHPPTGKKASGSGTFESISSAIPGFLRPNPLNPFRWQFDNGQPFVPLGFNDCQGANDFSSLEGGDARSFWGGVSLDQYLGAYENSGFNMFRFSQENCSPRLADASFRNYDKDTAVFFDWFMQQLRNHNFRIFYGLFGNLIPVDPSTPPPTELLKFVDYSVNRWGAYVDIWELQNEGKASDEWLTAVANHLRSRDPYRHPITTSWQRPELSVIDVNSPHQYYNENELESDTLAVGTAGACKEFGKPVILGEQGNEGGSWRLDSALRMRIRSWTAFFKEVSYLFWNKSGDTGGRGGYIYLGPEERQYIHVLQWFSNGIIRPDTKILNVGGFDETLMRIYGLTSSNGVAAYIHHFADHYQQISGKTVVIDVPASGIGYWIDPATGKKLDRVEVSRGQNILNIPDFTIDVAFFSTAVSVLDTPPVAVVTIKNPQADGDLDNDGVKDFESAGLPFGVPPLTLSLDASASSDLDGGELSCGWDFGDGSPIQKTAAVDHTYSAGNFLTTLTVTDDEGNSASHSFLVRATGDPNPFKNNPPALNRLHDLTVREGELALITPWAADKELDASGYTNDDLNYKAKGLPPGASFGRRGADWSKQFWWVPDFSQSGAYEVEFMVRDRKGSSPPPQKVKIMVIDSPSHNSRNETMPLQQ
jgi:hypothetical protein